MMLSRVMLLLLVFILSAAVPQNVAQEMLSRHVVTFGGGQNGHY